MTQTRLASHRTLVALGSRCGSRAVAFDERAQLSGAQPHAGGEGTLGVLEEPDVEHLRAAVTRLAAPAAARGVRRLDRQQPAEQAVGLRPDVVVPARERPADLRPLARRRGARRTSDRQASARPVSRSTSGTRDARGRGSHRRTRTPRCSSAACRRGVAGSHRRARAGSRTTRDARPRPGSGSPARRPPRARQRSVRLASDRSRTPRSPWRVWSALLPESRAPGSTPNRAAGSGARSAEAARRAARDRCSRRRDPRT